MIHLARTERMASVFDNNSNSAGVLADLDPPPLDLDPPVSGYGPPSADLDPPTELSENIILNVLVEIDNTLRFSAY